MPDSEKTAMLLDELAALAPAQRRKVATLLKNVSETFAEVPDGKTASHVLGVLAHLLDPSPELYRKRSVTGRASVGLGRFRFPKNCCAETMFR